MVGSYGSARELEVLSWGSRGRLADRSSAPRALPPIYSCGPWSHAPPCTPLQRRSPFLGATLMPVQNLSLGEKGKR